MSMSVKQSEVEGIISAASKELEALFAQPLQKAEPPKEESVSEASEQTAPESEPSTPAAPESAESSAGEADAPSTPPEGLADDSSDESAPPAEGEEEAGTPPLEEGAESPSGDGEPEVPGALEVVYSQLSPELLKAHYVAIKKVIFAKHQNAMAEAEMAHGDGQLPTDAPPQEEGQESLPPHEDAEMVQKNESDSEQETLTKNDEEDMADLKKTEALTKEINDLKKGFEQVQKVLELAFSRPERKAVTTIEPMAKSENKPVDANEVRAKATALTTDPEKLAKLTKSERDLLLGYFDGSVDVSKIAVFLNK